MKLIRAELHILGELVLDGDAVLGCDNCPNASGLSVSTGPLRFESMPAWVNCLACGNGWEEAAIPNGLLNLAVATQTIRTKATQTARVSATWKGHSMAGDLVPEFCLDDARVALTTLWEKAAKPAVKRRFRRARREAAAATRSAGQSLAATATQAAAYPKSAVLAAAWQARTGVALEDTPAPAKAPRARKCPSCKGKGAHQLKTRVHSEARVPCALCHGTGDRDQILAL